MKKIPQLLEAILYSEITLMPGSEFLQITTVTDPASKISTHIIGPAQGGRIDYIFAPNRLAKLKVVELKDLEGVCHITLSDNSRYQLHHSHVTMPQNAAYEELPYTHYLERMFVFI